MSDELFDELKNLFEKRTQPTDTKNVFMLQRFLSMSQKGFGPAALTNFYSAKIPSWSALRLMFLTVPTTPTPKNLYIKARKDQSWSLEVLHAIARHLCCNMLHAAQTAELLKRQNIDVYGLFGMKRPTVKGNKDDAKKLQPSKVAGRKVRKSVTKQNKRRGSRPRTTTS